MPRYHVLAKGTRPVSHSNNTPWPCEIALCFEAVQRPVGFAEGAGHGSAGGVFSLAEALEPQWREHFASAAGEWLLPSLEQYSRGCPPNQADLLRIAAARLGHEPETYEVQLATAGGPAVVQDDARTAVDECVRAWFGNRLTRAEVLERIFNLPTLQHQLDLLSRLPPDFTEEVRVDVANVPASVDELLPGAHVPLSDIFRKKSDDDLQEQSRLYWTARLQRMRDLHEYFGRTFSRDEEAVKKLASELDEIAQATSDSAEAHGAAELARRLRTCSPPILEAQVRAVRDELEHHKGCFNDSFEQSEQVRALRMRALDTARRAVNDLVLKRRRD